MPVPAKQGRKERRHFLKKLSGDGWEQRRECAADIAPHVLVDKPSAPIYCRVFHLLSDGENSGNGCEKKFYRVLRIIRREANE